MQRLFKYLIKILVCILLLNLAAANNYSTIKAKYIFTNSQQEILFNNLLPNLRCLVCQNESLADSNAPLAEDLRQEVYQQVLAGKNQQEIIEYLTARYGEFILFKPRVELKTYLLWFAPFILLLLGFILVMVISKRHRNQAISLTAAQRTSAEELLRNKL